LSHVGFYAIHGLANLAVTFQFIILILLTGDVLDYGFSNVDAEEEERKQLEEVL